MMGCLHADKNGTATPVFRAAVYDAVLPLATGGSPKESGANDDPARCLAALDRARAAHDLASPRSLRPDNPYLNEVLGALNELGAPADAAVLRRIMEAASGRTAYPWPSVHSRAIVALARTAPDTIRPDLDRLLESGDQRTRAGAAEALRSILGLPDPYKLWGDEERIDSLPVPVRHIIGVVGFEAEVNNGGLAQYFFNSAGDHWPIALEGMRAIGCPLTASILERAVAVVGGAGPSTDRDKRIKQYADLSGRADQALDDLDSEFFKHPEDLGVAMTRYMAANAPVFTPLA